MIRPHRASSWATRTLVRLSNAMQVIRTTTAMQPRRVLCALTERHKCKTIASGREKMANQKCCARPVRQGLLTRTRMRQRLASDASPVHSRRGRVCSANCVRPANRMLTSTQKLRVRFAPVDVTLKPLERTDHALPACLARHRQKSAHCLLASVSRANLACGPVALEPRPAHRAQKHRTERTATRPGVLRAQAKAKTTSSIGARKQT